MICLRLQIIARNTDDQLLKKSGEKRPVSRLLLFQRLTNRIKQGKNLLGILPHPEGLFQKGRQE